MNLRLRSRFVLVTFTRKMHGQSDSPKESAMALAALKRKPDLHPQPELKTYHVAVIVTRAEEWCVEAESPEEARELLVSRPRAPMSPWGAHSVRGGEPRV